MGLRITRAVNTVVYGGYDLDETNPNQTSDHRIWIRGVRSLRDKQDCLVNITTEEGIEEYPLIVGGGELSLTPDLSVELVGVRERSVPPEPYCPACGRGHTFTDRQIPQAELVIQAPRSYKLIRDNARRLKR